MQEIYSSNPPVVTGIHNPNKSQARHHRSSKLSVLLRGITSKHHGHGDFYFLNCLHSFGTQNKLEFHKMVYEYKDFCNAVMPSEDTKLLEFNQY